MNRELSGQWQEAGYTGVTETPNKRFNPEATYPGATVHISWWQLAMLIVANKLSMLTTYAPIIATPPYAKEAWISAIIAGAVGTVIAIIVYFLGKRFPGFTAFTYFETILGKWLGKALGMVFVLFFIFTAGSSLHLFSEMISATSLRATPLIVITVTLAILSLQAAAGGFEVVARLGEIWGPVTAFSLILLILLSIPNMDLGRLVPMFDKGIAPVFEQSLSPIGVFGEISWIVILAMPFIAKPKDVLKGILIGNAIAVSLVSLGALFLASIFDSSDIAHMTFPSYTAARMINVGEIIQRVEWLISSIWIGTMTVKLSLLFYGAAAGVGSIFKLREYRWGLLPVVAVSVVFTSLYYKNVFQGVDYFLPANLLPIDIPFELFLPGMILIIALLRHRKVSDPVRQNRLSR